MCRGRCSTGPPVDEPLRWEDLPESLRVAIRWDALYWQETITGGTLFGCGCLRRSNGDVFLCDYHVAVVR